jgi:RNA polymerase sigma factor (sigma-70 family)
MSVLARTLDHIRDHVAGRAASPTDADLLTRFVDDRDADAFAELVRRHGPLVRGVARRRLTNAHDADDVVQATFLALARQANRLGRNRPLPGWLFTVAHRVACKTQRAAARRPGPLPDAITGPHVDPLDLLTGRELLCALDDELARLPDRYRLPLVLCGLEGLTRDEAATRLGWTLGSLRGRQERGRELLRRRLAARGLTATAMLTGGLLTASAEAMPPALVRAITAAAVVAPMATRTGWMIVTVGALLTTLGIGAGAALLPGEQPTPQSAPPAVVGGVPQPRVDAEGVPLPPGVLARLGSSRMRHAGLVYHVIFAPDGKTLASSSADGVRVWAAETGRLIQQFPGPAPSSQALGLTADGRELVFVTGADGLTQKPGGILRRFDPATGKELFRAELAGDKPAAHVFLSRTGKWLALARSNGQPAIVHVHDTATGKESFQIRRENWRVRGLAFTADDRTIAVPDFSDAIGLYDAATGQPTGELKREGSRYSFVAFAPDGRTLAALSAPDSGLVADIDLWDVPARKHLRRIGGPDVYSAIHITFSPDGKLLAQTSQRPDVILWDTATGREVRRLRCYPSTMASAFSPDGKTLAVASNSGTVTLWDVEAGKLRPASADPIIGISSLRFVDGGRRLIGTTGDIKVWDAASGREVHRYPEVGAVYGLAVLSPDRKIIAGMTLPRKTEFNLNLWDATTGKLIRTIEGKTPIWPSPTFTPDGRRVIVSGADNGIHLFDVSDAREMTLTGHQHRPSRLVVSADGRRLASACVVASAGGDLAVRLWDLATGKEIRQFMPRRGSALDMAFSPDGRWLAVVGGEPGRRNERGELQLWDVESGREVQSFEGHKERPTQVEFSPDGRMLATGCLDNVLRLWEVASGVERHRFAGQTGAVYSVTFAPDGRTLAASSADAPGYVWDIYARSEAPQPPTADELNQCWSDLAATDAAVAFRSIRRLVNAPDAAVTLLRDRLKPTPAADAVRVKELIQKLDNPKFAERQSAAKELNTLADAAADQLRAALNDTKSAEERQQLQATLDRLEENPPELLRAIRAVEVLEQIATPAAREHLKTLAGGAPGATLTRAAADALARLKNIGSQEPRTK